MAQDQPLSQWAFSKKHKYYVRRLVFNQVHPIDAYACLADSSLANCLLVPLPTPLHIPFTTHFIIN